MKMSSSIGRYFVIFVCLTPVYVLGRSTILLLAFDAHQGHAFRYRNLYLLNLVQCFVFGALAWGIATKRTWARYISIFIFALIAVVAGWAAFFSREGFERIVSMIVASISAVNFIWLAGPWSRSEFQMAEGKS
jgi:hypothetical protein